MLHSYRPDNPGCQKTPFFVAFGFVWRDSADNNHYKLMTLSFDEFLRRFLLHLLPKDFVRIRNFSFLVQSSPVNLGRTITEPKLYLGQRSAVHSPTTR
jgi:Putative transposase